MSDYRRFISYIYAYEQGEKQENTGFVKVNARGEECKIWVHMKGFYMHGQEPYRVYVFLRSRERLNGWLLGELENQNGALEWNGVTQNSSLMDSGITLEESRGIYIEGNGRIFASEWDDYPIDVEQFTVMDESAEEVQETVEAAALCEAEEEKDSRSRQWEYLVHHFPVMQYRDGESLICSIRLEQRDLAKIPRDRWEVGNNSFLLHGFYQYHHLLLLRRQREKKVQYLLGVPGVYNEREQMMASMFGFEEFKMLKSPELEKESFGYWCRVLK